MGLFSSASYNFNRPVNLCRTEAYQNSLNNTFSSFTELNSLVTLPNNVIYMNRTFASCFNFNQPVDIPNTVIDMGNTFSFCYNFNSSVNIPNSVMYMNQTFQSCRNFNQSVNIPTNMRTMNQCFWDCESFNQPINIVDVNTEFPLNNVFYNCGNFNSPIRIENTTAPIISSFLIYCSNYNAPIYIANSNTNLVQSFYECYNYNSNFTIENSNIYTMYNVFAECGNSEGKISILNSNINYMTNAFMYQKGRFNAPLEIKNSVIDQAPFLFFGCWNQYSAPINIINSTINNLAYAFNGCSSFNAPITIENSYSKDMRSMLESCRNFNQSINIPEKTENLFNTFAFCSNFNQQVNILSTDVSNMLFTFFQCTNLNSKINFPDNFQENSNMSYTFFYCNNFNQPVSIPNGVTGLYKTFSDCAVLNQPISIPNSASNLGQAFFNCYNFNQPISIPNGVSNLGQTFFNCYNFNQFINMPNEAVYGTDMSCFLEFCYNFNQPLTIPNNVISMAYTFYQCYNFNQPINIPSSVVTLAQTFGGCNNFNQPIDIPNNITNMFGTFWNCSNFNQPISIPDNVTNMAHIFWNCNSFNQPINIPNKATDLSNAFQNCFNFNQPIIIPNGVTNLYSTFYQCYNFNQDIIIPGTVQNLAGIFVGCKNLRNVILEEGITTYADSVGQCNNGHFSIPNSIQSVSGLASVAKICYDGPLPVNNWGANRPFPHEKINYTIDKEPTCTEVGIGRNAVCRVCGKKFDTFNIPTIEHNYENGVCTICGKEQPYTCEWEAVEMDIEDTNKWVKTDESYEWKTTNLTSNYWSAQFKITVPTETKYTISLKAIFESMYFYGGTLNIVLDGSSVHAGQNLWDILNYQDLTFTIPKGEHTLSVYVQRGTAEQTGAYEEGCAYIKLKPVEIDDILTITPIEEQSIEISDDVEIASQEYTIPYSYFNKETDGNINNLTITNNDNFEYFTLNSISLDENNIIVNITPKDVEAGSENTEVLSITLSDGTYSASTDVKFTVYKEKIVTNAYEVVSVSGASYGFTLNTSTGYYVSGNKGKSNSAAVCKLVFTSTTGKLILDCINYAEAGWDYGIISNLDTTLGTTYSVDSTNVYKTFKNSNSSSVQTVTYSGLDTEEHFIYIKFRKDSSDNKNNDTLQFKVRFE